MAHRRAIGRSRRGFAVLMTVLLCVVAASIAFAVARQTILSVGSAAGRADAGTGWRISKNTLEDIEAQLAADPEVFLRRVLPQERARVCLAGSAAGASFEPGAVWPTECGAVWHYQKAAVSGDSRVEITPPSPTDPDLKVRVLSLAGGIDTGFDARFTRDGADRWTFATTGAVDLGVPAPSTAVNVTGSVYARGTVTATGALNGPVAVHDAYIATDTAFAGTPADSVAVVWLSPTPTAGPPAVANVRSVQPVPLTAGTLAAAAATLPDVGCPGGTPANITTFSSSLCLHAGQTVTTTDATNVTVPASTASYLLVFQPAGAVAAPTVKIWVSSQPVSTDRCDPQPGCAPYGSSPGDAAWWTNTDPAVSTLLGTFYYPTSGVIATDGTTMIGVCSSTPTGPGTGDENRRGLDCATQSGTTSGLTSTLPVTVVAGSLSEPQDLIVGSSIHAPGGGVALVATGRVLFPYWIRTAGVSTVVDADLVGLGLGDETVPSITGFAGTGPNGAELTVTGSVAGNALTFGVGGWAATTYTYRPAGTATAPWFSGVDPAWVQLGTDRISGDTVCQARQCPDF